MGIKSVL